MKKIQRMTYYVITSCIHVIVITPTQRNVFLCRAVSISLALGSRLLAQSQP